MSREMSYRPLEETDRVAEASGHLRTSIILPVLDMVGDYWTFRILAAMLAGRNRFDTLQASLGIARSTLSGRLEDLVQHGLATRHQYQSNPPRDDYILTEVGRDILPVVLLIQRWDATWGPDEPDGGSGITDILEFRHRTCGQMLRPVLVCRACGQPVRVRDVSYAPGPGARPDGLPSRQRRARRRSAPTREGADLLTAGEILGDRWTALVGATPYFGLRRFSDMQAALDIAPNILSRRLAQLTGCGIFARHVYQDRPRRAQYILTEKGLDLYPITLAMIAWGDRWFAPAEGPPLLLHHKACGNELDPVLACATCANPIDADTLIAE